MSAVLDQQIQQLHKLVQEQQGQIDSLMQAVFREKVLTTQTVYHTIQSLLNAKQAPTLALIASALKVDKMYVVEVLANNSQHIRYSNKNQIEELIAIKNTKEELYQQGKLFYVDHIDYGQKKIIRLNNPPLFEQLKEQYVSHSYGDKLTEYVISATEKNFEFLKSKSILNGSDDTIDWEKESQFLWKE